MARKKKITVRARLNKEIAAKYNDVSKGPMYPIYIDINYDRRFTKFPYGSGYCSSEDFESLMSSHSILKSHIDAIERMVSFESNRHDDFTLKGFGKKVKSYFSDFHKAAYLAAAHFVMDELKGRLPYEDYLALTDRSAIKQIDFGLHIFEENNLNTLKAMVNNAKLTELIWGDGLVLTWLLNYVESDLLDFIKDGLEKAEDSFVKELRADFGEKITPRLILKRLNNTAFYIIDKEIVIA